MECFIRKTALVLFIFDEMIIFLLLLHTELDGQALL